MATALDDSATKEEKEGLVFIDNNPPSFSCYKTECLARGEDCLRLVVNTQQQKNTVTLHQHLTYNLKTRLSERLEGFTL